MRWNDLDLVGGGLQGLLPWVGVYHHLAFQRDTCGGLGDDDSAELLDDLEDHLAHVAALACGAVNARLCAGCTSVHTAVRALGLTELSVDDTALLDDGQVIEVWVEHPPSSRWYHFTGVVQPRGDGAGLRPIALVASHGSRRAPSGEPA